MINYLLELIYPNVCGLCNEINKDSLCEKCKLKLEKLDITKIDNYTDKNFNKHIYIFKYDKEIRKMLLDYKFNEKSYLYKTFSKIIIKNQKVCDFIKEYDMIIPVPLHKKRLKSRGYNQCELIMKEVSKTNRYLKVNSNILEKVKNSLPQSTLNKKERIENIKEAYIVKNYELIKNKKILIFDDIFTTGSTVDECSRILMKYNPKEIGIFTIAKD